MTLVIMAAGMGSRYGGLKQMDPIGPHGEFLLDYSIYDAIAAGFDKVVCVIRKEHQNDFEETVGSRIHSQVKFEYAFQELSDIPCPELMPPKRTKPWGTAHAVLSCRHLVSNPFAVINADDFYGAEAFSLLYSFLKGSTFTDRYHYGMVGYRLKNTLTSHGTVSRGICEVDKEGKLLSIQERTKIQRKENQIQYTEDDQHWISLPENSITSLNCWGFTPDIFYEIEKDFKEFLQKTSHLTQAELYLPTVIDHLMKKGYCDVKVLPTSEKWYGVTYQEDREEVVSSIREKIKAGIYPENLWNP